MSLPTSYIIPIKSIVSQSKRAKSLPSKLSKNSYASRNPRTSKKKNNALVIRKKFINKLKLTENNHYNYINSLLGLVDNIDNSITQELRERGTFEISKIPYTIRPENPNKNLMFFGGALFFIIYYEAVFHNIINPKSKDFNKLVTNFLQYSTTDIDVIFNFNIFNDKNHIDIDDIEDIEDTKNITLNVKRIIHETYDFIFKSLYEKKNSPSIPLIKKIKLILDADTFAKSNNSNLLDSNKSDNVLNVSIKDMGDDLVGGSEIMRVNIETCVDKYYCDHICDILNIYNYNDKGNLIEFSSFKKTLLCQNLFQVSRENVDRLLQNLKRNSLEKTKIKLREELKTLNAIKYYQGYYRVKIVYEILKKCKEEVPLYMVFNVLPGYIITNLQKLVKYLKRFDMASKSSNINTFIDTIRFKYFKGEAKKNKRFLAPAEKDDIVLGYEYLLQFWEIIDNFIRN